MRLILVCCAIGVLAARGYGAPLIQQVVQATAPTAAQAVVIYSAVDSQAGVLSSVVVRYTVNAWQSQAGVVATQSAGKVYLGTIPGFAAGTTVHYTVIATALDGSSAGAATNSYLVRGPANSNIVCRIMAANTTSGTQQAYEEPGIRIFQGLKPDVVAINEFNYKSGTIRQLVDIAFGTNFYYYRGGGGSLPNGVVSRWPIIASGDWPSPVAERDFSWATISLPGSRRLHVVSVHLPTSSATSRNIEAYMVKTNVLATFATTDYIVVGGDLNTATRTEAAITIFNTFLSNAATPRDQAGNDNTNRNRDNPYDWVMPNAVLAAHLVPTVVLGHSFSNGLVYDSRVTTPYTMLPSPILAGDSGVEYMQHMAVIKDFNISWTLPFDSAPTLRGASNVMAAIAEPLVLHVIGSDHATQQVTLTCSDSAHFTATPAFGTVTGVFAWTPGETAIGDHAVTFTARADGLAANVMINISVVPEPGPLVIATAWLVAHCCRRQRTNRTTS